MTLTRTTLAVPAPSPETSISLGQTWTGTTWNNTGLCVNTDGRVWLDANGATSTSTFTALSNGAADGSDANNDLGQLLLQSLKSNVVMVSQESNVFSSAGSVLIAAGGGVKMIAGHGAPLMFGVGDDSLSNVAPDEQEPTSDFAGNYVSHMDDVALGWTITDTIVAVGLTALDVALTIADCKGGGSFAGTGAALGVMGAAANLAGGTVNIIGTQGGDLPGLNMHAFYNVNLTTTGFCSMYAGAGLLLFGGITSGLGFVTAGITAGVNAALKSTLWTLVEGKTVEYVGGKSADIRARSGKLHMWGKTVVVGAAGGESRAQLPTTDITAEVVDALNVTSSTGAISQTSGGEVAISSHEIELEGGQEVLLKSANYEVKISLSEITIALQKTTKVVVGTSNVKADVQGIMALEVGASVKAGGSAASIEVDGTGSWVWKGPQVNFI